MDSSSTADKKAAAAAIKAERAYNRSLLGVADARKALGASDVEWKSWASRGLIPSVKSVDFQKWGKTLQTKLYDPAVLFALAERVPEWRAASAAKKAATKAAAKSDRPPIGIRQTRRSLICRALKCVALESGSHCAKFVAVTPFGRHEFLLHVDGLPSLASAFVEGAGDAVLGDYNEILRACQAELSELLANVSHAVKAAGEGWRARLSEEVAGLGPPDRSGEIASLLSKSVFVAISRLSILARQTGMLASQVTQEIGLAVEAGLQEGGRSYRAIVEQESFVESVGFGDYPSFFPAARSMRRRLVFHRGPTNSGKTHAAMEQLLAAKTGCYLAPLRLMALENFDRMRAAGVMVSMVTGEEVLICEGATHVSSTIEMADLSEPVEVAVVDEVQLLADADRGWAWTQGIIGIPAKSVILTGSPDALELVKAVCRLTGEDLEVVDFQRKTPLEPITGNVSINKVQAGDAIVAFSRIGVLRLRERIMLKGLTVATIYGGLGPEVRRSESSRFRNGEASVLVATDAIGMGLNLPIQRVLFTDLEKFDGKVRRTLTPSELRQVAGRAGRYGLAEKGLFGVMDGISPKLLRQIYSQPLPAGGEPRKLYVMPPWPVIQAVADFTGNTDLAWLLRHTTSVLMKGQPAIKPPSIGDALKIASVVRNSKLSLQDQHRYVGCPLADGVLSRLSSWSKAHGEGIPVLSPAWGEHRVPKNDLELQECEEKVKLLSAYLWLSLRWPDIYRDAAQASNLRRAFNDLILQALQKKALDSVCRQCGRSISKSSNHRICDRCYRSSRPNWSDFDD